MTNADSLFYPNSLDAELWAGADRLLVNAPSGAYAPELRIELRDRCLLKPVGSRCAVRAVRIPIQSPSQESEFDCAW